MTSWSINQKHLNSLDIVYSRVVLFEEEEATLIFNMKPVSMSPSLTANTQYSNSIF